MTSNNFVTAVAVDARSHWQKTREFLTEAEVANGSGLVSQRCQGIVATAPDRHSSG